MAGILHKIEEKLHMGGGENKDKKDDPSKDVNKHHSSGDAHKDGDHKEGIVDKMKDKLHGGDHKGSSGGHEGEKKKKKKEKKKHDDGHESSSSSDSD